MAELMSTGWNEREIERLKCHSIRYWTIPTREEYGALFLDTNASLILENNGY